MRKRAIAASWCLAVSVWAANGRAQSERQPWLGDRRFESGAGIRVGKLELHPGVAGEVGYDTNFFQAAGAVTGRGQVVVIEPRFRPVTEDGVSFGTTGVFTEPRVGTFRLRVTPSLTLSTLSARRTDVDGPEAAPPKLNLRAQASLSYNELLATDAQYSDAVSDNRFVSADLGVSAEFLPERPWGASLMGQYNRSVQPVNDPAAPPGFQRSTFRAGGGVAWRPGGGLLEWTLGYNITYVLFEDAAFSAFNSVANDLTLRGRWLFLPRTALIYAGNYGVFQYPSGGSIKPPGSPLSSLVGLNGLVTSHFGVTTMVGYKTIFFSRDAEFDSPVGSLELAWYPLPRPDLSPEAAGVGLSSISLGYRRDAQASYIGNYVQNDSAIFKADYFIGGVVLMTFNASLDHLRRPTSFFSDGTRQSAAFSENRITATLFGEYRTSDSFAVNTTLRYSSALTDQVIPVENDPGEQRLPYDDFGFRRIEAWVGVRWFL